jgi:hypothetical protein
MLFIALLAAATTLWQHPSRVEEFDMSSRGTVPTPPYGFVREDMGGTSPKVLVRDAAGIEWRVKGGHDVKAETFITRFVSALGYYAETTHFLAEGRIQNVPLLKRASGFIKADGSFTWAAFEKVEPDAKFAGSWSWVDNPFAGTPELKALKVLVMLFSNWDNKDSRDTRRGSNTSILEFSDGRKVYFVNDWGQSFGSWGRMFGRDNWNCKGYRSQTRSFVVASARNFVRFGYGGQHTDDFKAGIQVGDVRWLMQYLGRITDAQIRVGFKFAGASQQEEACFAGALRERIEQLRRFTIQ